MKKIEPISKTKTVDYSSKPLENIWQLGANQNWRSNKDRAFKDELKKILSTIQEGIVCIQTETMKDEELIKQIFDIAQNFNVRFYILVNEYSKELDSLNGICLIRYELKNKGSFVLINPNSNQPKGLFFSGQLTEQSMAVSQHIFIHLSEHEIAELFRHFCYQFWEVAKKEVIEKEKHNEISTKPLDVWHNKDKYGDKDFVYSTLFPFIESQERRTVSEQPILYLNQETQPPTYIKERTETELKDHVSQNLLPKDEFENQEPNFPDDGVSVQITYKWQNVPYYLPDNAKEHSLYERWKNEKNKIRIYLDTLLSKIQQTEEKENIISKAIAFLFLSKKNVFEGIKTDIQILKDNTDYPNLPENVLKEKINRINEINLEVQKHAGEIEIEDRKAKLNEEIKELKQKKITQETELENQNKELKEKEKEAQEKLNNFLKKHNIESKDLLGKTRNEWQQKAGKKNKEQNPEEAKEAQDKLDELKEIESQDFTNKLKSEIQRLEKEIKRLDDDIKRKENEISKIDEKKDEKKENTSSLSELLSNKTSNQSSNSEKFSIPSLPQLPKIGKLYELNNQSYLAIEFWEEYETAKSEAERLKAKLCTIKTKI